VSILTKEKTTIIKLGTPAVGAVPGTAGVPGTPARCYRETVTKTVCGPNQLCLQSISELGLNPTGGMDAGGGMDITQHSAYYTSKCAPAMICSPESVTEYVCKDAVAGTPATPGIAGTPATPTEITEHFNEGWNTWSRSILDFEHGDYLLYSAPNGVRGIMMAIGVEGRHGDRVESFSHSILIEPGGVMAFKDGVKVKTVSYLHNATTQIRFYRQADGSLICVVVNGTDTKIHMFDGMPSTTISAPLKAYCYMYMGDDVVSDADFVTGKVHFGEA